MKNFRLAICLGVLSVVGVSLFFFFSQDEDMEIADLADILGYSKDIAIVFGYEPPMGFESSPCRNIVLFVAFTDGRIVYTRSMDEEMTEHASVVMKPFIESSRSIDEEIAEYASYTKSLSYSYAKVSPEQVSFLRDTIRNSYGNVPHDSLLWRAVATYNFCSYYLYTHDSWSTETIHCNEKIWCEVSMLDKPVPAVLMEMGKERQELKIDAFGKKWLQNRQAIRDFIRDEVQSSEIPVRVSVIKAGNPKSVNFQVHDQQGKIIANAILQRYPM